MVGLEEEVVVVVVVALRVFVVCCVVVVARMFAGLRRRATTKARTTDGDTGLSAEPKEEDAMGDEGGGKGLRRWQARRWGAEYARCGMGWGGMGRKRIRPRPDLSVPI